MYCCISGEVPQEPVVSKSNGCLYEKRLIEKYLAENGRDPRTGEPMSKSDLIYVSGGGAAATAQQRSVGATSIPGLLNVLQGEWDALMLEQFSLRQQLAAAQQELSQALFQHDAACRVIAKLMKERDALRAEKQLANGGDSNTDATLAGTMGDDDSMPLALPDQIAKDIDTMAEQLKAARQNKEVSRSLALEKDISDYAQLDSHESHSKATGAVPVHCVAVNDNLGNRLVYSGGADGKCIAYDAGRCQVSGTMIGHTQAVRAVQAAGDVVVTCSDDSTCRLWKSDNGAYQSPTVIKGHKGPVLDLTLLPSLTYVLTGGLDGNLIFSDLHSGLNVAQRQSVEAAGGITRVSLHPDGYLAATASLKKILLWDVKMMNVEMSLTVDSTVESLAMAQDGWTMAAGTHGGVVQLWDLRNTQQAHSTIAAPIRFDDSPTAQPSPVTALSFDSSAKYLAVGTHNVKVLDVASRNILTSINNHTGPVTGVAWGADAHWLASSSSDRSVRLYGTGK